MSKKNLNNKTLEELDLELSIEIDAENERIRERIQIKLLQLDLMKKGILFYE